MKISDNRIDGGRPFDWGKTSEDYAKYRDVYPEIFYRKIADRGLCLKGQRVLDLGTGTGVLPRNMYHYGAEWTGVDISPEQIAQAEKLSAAQKMDVRYFAAPAENLCFPAASFDVVTACQCFFYFDHDQLAPELYSLLKPDGTLLILYMTWLPLEDPVAAASERLVLKYSPGWTGAGETRRPISIPDAVQRYFDLTDREEYDVRIPFTTESWHGRMRACRGVAASLSEEKLALWESEHLDMLKNSAPDHFTVLHHAALAVLKKKPNVQ